MATALARIALLVCVALLPAAAQAQAPFPSQPIRVLVNVPQGGAPDVLARLIADQLAEIEGWLVVIQNRTGRSGNMASEQVAKAPADGHTLLLGSDSAITISPHVYDNLGFDPLQDLLPVASLASSEFTLSVNPQVPVKTFAEFIEYARNSKPPLTYASGGTGSQHQLMMEMLRHRAGIELVHVPFRGAAPAVAATVAGDTKVVFSGSSSIKMIRSGQLRALAASGKQRLKRFPELPTIGEFYPGYAGAVWLGLFAPAGTPEPIVTALRGAVQKVLARADFAAKLAQLGGLEPLILSPAEFSQLIRDDHEKYGKVVKELGISLD